MLGVRGEGEDPWVEGTVRRTGPAKDVGAGIRAPQGCQTDVERGIHPSSFRLHPLMKERKSILLNNLLSTNDSLPSTSDSTRVPKTNAKSRLNKAQPKSAIATSSSSLVRRFFSIRASTNLSTVAR